MFTYLPIAVERTVVVAVVVTRLLTVVAPGWQLRKLLLREFVTQRSVILNEFVECFVYVDLLTVYLAFYLIFIELLFSFIVYIKTSLVPSYCLTMSVILKNSKIFDEILLEELALF